MTGAHVEEEPWERREATLLRFVPIGLLGVATVVTLLHPLVPSMDLTAILIVTGVAAAWVLVLDTLHPAWLERRPIGVIYYIGLLALSAILVVLMPWYAIFAFVGYLRAFPCLPGAWRLVGIGVNALVISFAQAGGVYAIQYTGLASFAVVALMNITLAGAFSYFGWRTIERDANRKQALADLAAAREENAGLHAQLLTQAREAGVLDERQRMAREIHDTLAQGLTGIITQLEAAAQSPARAQRHLDNAERLARESLSEARRSVHAVRPEALENARLPEALADVVRRWSEINAVPAEITTTGTARAMRPDVEVTLLRTAQEALANVAKHAGASRVGLTLSYMEDMVSLDVRDDGVGFAKETESEPIRPTGSRPTFRRSRYFGRIGIYQHSKRANGSGFGLTSMRQRVEGLDGRFEIESEPGAGTAISASIPIGG